MENREQKIHVDESWKDQVTREKEASRSKAAGSHAASKDPPTSEAVPSSAEETVRRHAAQTTGEEQPFGEPAGEHAKAPSRDYPLPPASLAFLITTIGTQAMVALGEVPNPLTGEFERLPNQAKHFIDTLAVLEEKTTGNRTPEESAVLTSLLQQLRMAYIAGGP